MSEETKIKDSLSNIRTIATELKTLATELELGDDVTGGSRASALSLVLNIAANDIEDAVIKIIIERDTQKQHGSDR